MCSGNEGDSSSAGEVALRPEDDSSGSLAAQWLCGAAVRCAPRSGPVVTVTSIPKQAQSAEMLANPPPIDGVCFDCQVASRGRTREGKNSNVRLWEHKDHG